MSDDLQVTRGQCRASPSRGPPAWRSPRRRCRWRCRLPRWRASATARPIWISAIGARQSGGSFLATERKLTQVAAHANPEVAGAGAAQSGALLSRQRLCRRERWACSIWCSRTIRHWPATPSSSPCARRPDYMMGRYRDAHNDLGSPAFDADRHASLWRGLIEAALEDWKDAHAHLEQARAGAEPLPRHRGRRPPPWPMWRPRWAWDGWIWPMPRSSACPRRWTPARRCKPTWIRPG